MGERIIHDNVMTFYFPFSYRQKDFQALTKKLQEKEYTLFQLHQAETAASQNETETLYELEQFFYPFVQEKLFPSNVSAHALNRFYKNIEVKGQLQTRHREMSFMIDRLDITICPFETGILSLLVHIEGEEQLDDVIDFMRNFRQLVSEPQQKDYFSITVNHQQFASTEQLLYDYLMPFLPSFFMKKESKSGYIGSLPYFEDERMYTTCLLMSDDDTKIETKELYKLAHLDGRRKDGSSKISSFNEQYIDDYIESHSYLRWAPYLYVTTTMQSHVTLGNLSEEYRQGARQYFINTGYYNILIHYFYKIVLLKLSYEHSEIKWNTDKISAESLSENITLFSSKYYFQQVAIRSSGRDLSHFIRGQMRIDELFMEVKESVNELYRVLEGENQDRYNQLLFILTVYTVISGIIGMNLVIEDWQDAIDWGNLQYTFFEWVAFITGISGIVLSFALIVGAVIRFVMNYIRKRKY